MSFPEDQPTLTNCLREVLDEEVLRLLPHRIVAIRNARRRRRMLAHASNANAFNNNNNSLDQQQQQQQQRQQQYGGGGGGGGMDYQYSQTQQQQDEQTKSVVPVSSEEADKARAEAQKEMRTLVLDRSDFVPALTELLVERALLREAVEREKVHRYSASKLNMATLRNMSSTTLANQMSSDGYFSEDEMQMLVTRVWIFEKFKQFLQPEPSMLLSSNNQSTDGGDGGDASNKKKKRPVATGGGGGSNNNNNNNDNDNTSARRESSSPRRQSSASPPSSPNRATGRPLKQDGYSPTRKSSASSSSSSEGTVFMQYWRICPYASRTTTRIVFDMPKYQLHPADIAALEAAEEERERIRQSRAAALAALASSASRNNNNNEGSLSQQQSPHDDSFLATPPTSPLLGPQQQQQPQHQQDQNEDDVKMMLSTPPRLLKPAGVSGLGGGDDDDAINNNNTTLNNSLMFGSTSTGVPNSPVDKKQVELMALSNDRGAPFPADFLENLPNVKRLREKIEPLVDYVFGAADVDHTNHVTFRYITELILEREGRLTAVPYRPNLNYGVELVLDNHADGIRDMLLPRGTTHIASIERSLNLMLISNHEGSALVDGGTGRYVMKIKQTALRKPRILEMNVKEICYALLSERAREAQIEADKIVQHQQYENRIRSAASTAEQLALAAGGPSSEESYLGGDERGNARAHRAMEATATSGGANRLNDPFTQKTFRDSRYLVCVDGTMAINLYYYDLSQVPSAFAKDPDVRLRTPIVPTALACAGGYILVGDSLGHVRVLDATSVLMRNSFDNCVSGHYKGNHNYVQTHPRPSSSQTLSHYHQQQQQRQQQLSPSSPTSATGTTRDEFDSSSPIRTAYTSQNMRPENFQLGTAAITGLETLFHLGHNRFAFTQLDGTLSVIDIPTMSLFWCQEAHAGSALMLKRITGTDTFVTLGYDHSPRIWQGLGGLAVQSLRLTDQKQPHTTRISSVEFGLEELVEPTLSGDRIVATKLISADISGLVKIWSLHDNTCTHSLYTVDLKDSARLRKHELFAPLTAHAIANYQEAAPMQQGAYISSAGRFLYLGYRKRGMVKLCPAENTLRAHFGSTISLDCPITGIVLTAAGNSLRVWTLYPRERYRTPSPLLVDLVSPFVLGFIVMMCTNLEEERVYCATSTGCVIVFRIETGRVLKVFFPSGKGGLAAEATVLTAHERAGELVASEDATAFPTPDPVDEILGMSFNVGSQELYVHYAHGNILAVYSDVGKSRFPVRQIMLRMSNEEVMTMMMTPKSAQAAQQKQKQQQQQQAAAAAAAGTAIPNPNRMANLANIVSKVGAFVNSDGGAVNRFGGRKFSIGGGQQQNEFRGMPNVWSTFSHTASPSIVTLLPDLNLGIYSMDSETGIEHQRLTCMVELPEDDELFSPDAVSDGGGGNNKKWKPHKSNDEVAATTTTAAETTPSESTSTPTTITTNKESAAQRAAALSLLNSASGSGGGGIFKSNVKEKAKVHKKHFIKTATCVCFLGDYCFLAVGCALENAILIFPTRSGIHGRSESGLESRVTDFTPVEPKPCCVIHHASEPQLLQFAPVRQLLYVADNKCRVIAYSMSKWLATFGARCCAQLAVNSVHAPVDPKSVVPSYFHELPRWAVILAEQQRKKEAAERDHEKVDSSNKNNKNSTTTPTSTTTKDGFFLTQEEGVTNDNNGDDDGDDATTNKQTTSRKNVQDISKFNKLALSSIEFTERLLKNKNAPPIYRTTLVTADPSNQQPSNSSNSTAQAQAKANALFGTMPSFKKFLHVERKIDPLYEEWQAAQPRMVGMVPDAFHFADGGLIPKGETEPPWRRFAQVSSISVLDRIIAGGTAVVVSYATGVVCLFTEYLDRCIGELRADMQTRFPFTPCLSTTQLLLQQYQQQQQPHQLPKIPIFETVDFHNKTLRTYVLSYLQSAISFGGATTSLEKDESIRTIQALLALPSYVVPTQNQILSWQAQLVDHNNNNNRNNAAPTTTTSFSSPVSNSSFGGLSLNSGSFLPSSSFAHSGGSSYEGMSLWLSMAQKLGGNEEKRWHRFVQWRRLESWLRNLPELRAEIKTSRLKRQEGVDAEYAAEMQKQSLMTVTERRMYLKEQANSKRKQKQEQQLKNAREGASENAAGAPMEWLEEGKLVTEGEKMVKQRMGLFSASGDDGSSHRRESSASSGTTSSRPGESRAKSSREEAGGGEEEHFQVPDNIPKKLRRRSTVTTVANDQKTQEQPPPPPLPPAAGAESSATTPPAPDMLTPPSSPASILKKAKASSTAAQQNKRAKRASSVKISDPRQLVDQQEDASASNTSQQQHGDDDTGDDTTTTKNEQQQVVRVPTPPPLPTSSPPPRVPESSSPSLSSSPQKRHEEQEGDSSSASQTTISLSVPLLSQTAKAAEDVLPSLSSSSVKIKPPSSTSPLATSLSGRSSLGGSAILSTAAAAATTSRRGNRSNTVAVVNPRKPPQRDGTSPSNDTGDSGGASSSSAAAAALQMAMSSASLSDVVRMESSSCSAAGGGGGGGSRTLDNATGRNSITTFFSSDEIQLVASRPTSAGKERCDEEEKARAEDGQGESGLSRTEKTQQRSRPGSFFRRQSSSILKRKRSQTISERKSAAAAVEQANSSNNNNNNNKTPSTSLESPSSSFPTDSKNSSMMALPTSPSSEIQQQHNNINASFFNEVSAFGSSGIGGFSPSSLQREDSSWGGSGGRLESPRSFADFTHEHSIAMTGTAAEPDNNNATSSSTSARTTTFGNVLFDQQQERSKNAIRGIFVTKQVRPVLSARGVGAQRTRAFAAQAHEAIGQGNREMKVVLEQKVGELQKISVREVVEDAKLPDAPHMFDFNSILSHDTS